ncbi:MAG: hypothetical protein E2O39_16935, partial [Planctomycetota bacterium]
MSERTGSSTAAERLFQEWLDLYRSGVAPGVETFLADTPDMPEALALEVRELAAGYERLRSRIGAGGGGSKPGRLIGDFQLIRQLGAGGIGVVWEAEQLSLKRRVALKLLSPYFSLSERTLERFHREAEAGARLAHPGIVPILSVGEEEGVHFMAQELVPEGRTLADRIADLRSRAELPRGYYAGVVELFTAVAEALGHAHSQGVVHRDVKPSNILLTPDGRPKVADFGLALVDDSSDLSRTGEVMGTPYYMSPEQVASRLIRIDHRTDVFSLGATLYEALTLTRPFEGDTSQQVYEKILTVDPVDPRVVRSRVPRDLSVICTKALEKDVQRRYADMQAFAADLGRFARNEPIVARPPGPIERAVKWTKRHPIPTTGGGVAAVALIVITILFFKIRDERDRAWQQAYRASIGPAALTLESDSFQAAQEMLAACPTILRGWVWKHLGLWHSRSRLSLDAFDQRVTGIAYSPDGRRLVAGCFDNSVRVFDAESGELIATLSGLRGNPGRVVFGADGKTLYAVATNYSDDGAGRVHTWDAETLAEIASWVAQKGRVDAFAISGDGARVATGGEAGFRLFDARTHALLLAVDEPGGRVWSIALDADGSRVVTGTDDETVRVWDAASGKELLVLAEPQAKVTALALDPDGRRIVAGTEAGAVHIWDARTGAPLGVFLEHTAQVSSLAIDPNGSRVVSGSEDGSVRIWDLEGRAAREVPEATRGGAAWDDSDLLWREGPVAAVTFHPLGDRVAFCLRDGSMRVVDALADEPVTVLRGQGAKILCVAFDAAGERVATGTQLGSLWI